MSDAPSGVSIGTDSANTPFSRYPAHRVTISLKCVRDSGSSEGVGIAPSLCSWAVVWASDSGGKKAGERREEIADLKSGGVTSETNQGSSFGLRVARVKADQAMIARKKRKRTGRQPWRRRAYR